MSGSSGKPDIRATCACGSVAVTARGAPIVCAVCYCDDCQEAGRRIESLPNAPAVLGPDKGTEYVLIRKDRVAVERGESLLRAEKLVATSPTNRMVATCCNSAMFLRFDRGPHWVSVYRSRVKDPPPIEMRLNTKFAPDATAIPDDVPRPAGFPFAFVGRLIAARVAMLFS